MSCVITAVLHIVLAIFFSMLSLCARNIVPCGSTIIMFETEAYMGYLLLGEIGDTVL
jgi:hypothetical protein